MLYLLVRYICSYRICSYIYLIVRNLLIKTINYLLSDAPPLTFSTMQVRSTVKLQNPRLTRTYVRAFPICISRHTLHGVWGITITSILGKVLCHMLNEHVKQTLHRAKHKLQFSFSPRVSPSMAALICTEVLANNRDCALQLLTCERH